MKTSGALSLAVAAAATTASATTITYDTGYDMASRSMNAVACSNGANGLITRYGWQTQGQIPDFPYIGGSSTIPGWNSPNCGQCFNVTYNGRTIHVLAIDYAANGLNIGQTAMNALTNGQAAALGHVDATIKNVPVSNCGIAHPKREEDEEVEL